MLRFAHPWLLLALPLAALPVWTALRREARRRVASLRYSDLGSLRGAPSSARVRAARMLPYARALALVLAIFALARLQAGHRVDQVSTEGIDIVVALDNSGSMRAEDFSPRNRLTVAKRTIDEFIAGRQADRIGLVTFARYTETRCPVTLDYGALGASLEAVSFADQRDDGTAIGSGLATAVNRLRASEAKSRVVVLLTDGINNAGSIDPVTAADLARAVGVRIHTVGVGSDGPVIVPLADGSRARVELPIDEGTLRRIAAATGGRYFRASDAGTLEEVFRMIDAMERTAMRVTTYGRYDELFAWLLAPSLLLLAFDFALTGTVLGRVP
jgi:Ca-activated chloride channel family protein